MYDAIKYIHILAAVIWVGGAFYAQLLSLRLGRANDPAAMARLGKDIEVIGTRVFIPASIVLFLAGAYMVTNRWAWEQAWVAVAVLLWLGSILVGSLYLGPRAKRIGEAIEAEGPTSPTAAALLDRVYLVSRLELVSFAVIIALMVFKPGV